MKSEQSPEVDTETESLSPRDRESYHLIMVGTLNELALKALNDASELAAKAAALSEEAKKSHALAEDLMNKAIFHATTLATLKDGRAGQVDW